MKKVRIFILLSFSLSLAACGGTITESPGEEISKGVLRFSDGTVSIDVAEAMSAGSKITVSKVGNLDINPIETQSLGSQAVLSAIADAPAVDVTFSNGEIFKYNNYSGVAFYDGDIAFGNSSSMPSLISAYETNKNSTDVWTPPLTAESTISKRGFICTFQFLGCWAGFNNAPAWPNKTAYYKFGVSISQSDQIVIESAIATWNSSAGTKIRWLPSSANPSAFATTFVKVYNNPFFDGLAPIGYTMQKALPYIYLSQKVLSYGGKSTIQHEMGHASGLNHEHQRCDRDKYINLNVAQYDRIFNFANINKLCTWGEDIGPFDYDSLMLYRMKTSDSPFTTPKFTRYPTSTDKFTGTKQISAESYGEDPETLSSADIAYGLATLYP